MARAKLVLQGGTKVDIEGTVEEVAKLLDAFASEPPAATSKTRTHRGKTKRASSITTNKLRRKGPQALIAELAEENYFKSKRTIGDIQKKLEEKGHIYAQESLSTPLLRLTRKKTLRRLKEKGNWVYVS